MSCPNILDDVTGINIYIYRYIYITYMDGYMYIIKSFLNLAINNKCKCVLNFVV